jgi:hypothetical protein
MSELTHKELLESKRNFDLDMMGVFTLMEVLNNGGLNESAVIDITDKLESYVIDIRDAYKELWQYVDETTPNEKEKDNE